MTPLAPPPAAASGRLPETRKVYPADVVLCEGILVFYQPEVRSLFDMKLFVDTDADTRLSRRVRRDTRERGRDLDMVLDQYTRLVKPAFEEFCLPVSEGGERGREGEREREGGREGGRGRRERRERVEVVWNDELC